MNLFFPLKSLPDQIYENLSENILSGRLVGGERLVETELCKQFSTSRAPIRESFRRLESEGLVVIHPRKGTFVRKLSHDDIEEAFAVRMALEGLAAYLAVPLLTNNDLQKMADLISEMDLAIKKNDAQAFREYDHKWHDSIIMASKNSILQQTLQTLAKGVWLRISFTYYQSTAGFVTSNKMHKNILNSFKKREQDKARKLLEAHIEYAKGRILKLYDRIRES